MSDKRIFTKTKPAEIKAEIEQTFKKSKPHSRLKIVLHKVIANVILNNNELGTLMPDIVSLLKIDDLEIRKMCLSYIASCGSTAKPAEVNAALPFLDQLSKDSNPTMRALSIKTRSSVNVPAFVDSSFELIKFNLEDPDSEVRKISAYAVSRLFQYDHVRVENEGLIDSLNDLLYDPDTEVVANALASLSYITDSNKNLSLGMDSEHARRLITLLSGTNEWCQIYILNSLMSYVSQSSDESLRLIEGILPCLQHENSSVVLNSIKAIVYFCNYAEKPYLVIPSLSKRLGSSLASLLSKPPEIQFLVLRNVILLLLDKKNLISMDVEMFFCRYDDPIYIKDTKLEIIYLLANESNYRIVLRELEEYATEVDVSMARKAIRAFGNLAVKLPNAAEACVEILMDLTSNGISYIVQESVVVIKNIIRKYPGKFELLVLPVLTEHYKLIDEPDAKASALWILGQFCENIKNAPTILNFFISTFLEESIEVQYAALTAVTKFYLKFPQLGEPILLKVLKWATEDVHNPDIRYRGFFYWRLLSASSSNKEQTQTIVSNHDPFIATKNDQIDPAILEELELNIGTLASIYLKPVHHVFRLSPRRTLPYSPALQTKRVTNKGPGEEVQSQNRVIISAHKKPYQTKRPETSNSERSAIFLDRSGVSSQTSSETQSVDDNSSSSGPMKRLTRKVSVLTRRKSRHQI